MYRLLLFQILPSVDLIVKNKAMAKGEIISPPDVIVTNHDEIMAYQQQIEKWRNVWLYAIIDGLLSSNDTIRIVISTTLLSDILHKYDHTCVYPMLSIIHQQSCTQLSQLRAIIMILTTARRHVSDGNM